MKRPFASRVVVTSQRGESVLGETCVNVRRVRQTERCALISRMRECDVSVASLRAPGDVTSVGACRDETRDAFSVTSATPGDGSERFSPEVTPPRLHDALCACVRLSAHASWFQSRAVRVS